ncbi:unnamed protein product [Durusdinium trenchii]|uniref:Cyclic nucleotide-binding domain-containing protein n=1 Tax=Durusdinium trenchii TaxID=1381693 RepID=A0ABP0K8Z5_9DINO
MRATAFGVRRAKKKHHALRTVTKNNEHGNGRPVEGFEVEFEQLLREMAEGLPPSAPGLAPVQENPAPDRRSPGWNSDEPNKPLPKLSCMLHPQQPSKAVWDVLISGLIIYSVLVEPFRFCFHVEVDVPTMVIDILVDLLFVSDIVSIFFTAYYDEREALVTDRWMIARRYLLGFFVVDVISVFPGELLVMLIEPELASQARVVKLLRLVRLGRLFKLKRLLLLIEEKLHITLQMMEMLKMLLKVLFIVHLLACLTFLVATPICPDGMGPCRPRSDELDFWSNWVRMFQIDEFNLMTRYLSSFHFITATLMAVGYGDIYPSNSLERIMCIVSQITGAVLFGFLLSCITAVLEFTNPSELEHKKRMAEIKNWLRGRSLPQNLKMQVWSHFCFVTSRRALKDRDQTLLSLPTHLRSQLVESSQRLYFQALQAALGVSEKSFVAELVFQVAPMQVPFRMCIIEAGEVTTEIYIISSGRLEAVMMEEDRADEQLQAFLEICADRRSPGEEPLPEETPATLDTEEMEVDRSQRVARLKMSKSRSGLFQAKPISWLAEGVGITSRAISADDSNEILCGIYEDMEAVGHSAVSPVRFQGGSYNSEVFSINQDALERTLANHPNLQDFEARVRVAAKELARAILSAEWAPQGSSSIAGQTHRRLKGLIVYRGKATDVRQLPAEAFDEVDEAGLLQATIEKTPRVACKRRDKNGRVVTETEQTQDIWKRWVIPANDSRKIWWDLFIGALIVYSVIAITYSVSFTAPPAPFFVAVDVMVDCFFAVDMVLSFRTAFLDPNGLLNTVPSEIARHYLKTYFLVDFLSTAPIDRVVEAVATEASNSSVLRTLKLTRFARLFRLMKLARMLKLFKLVESAESSVEVSPLILRLMVLFMNVCFLAHVVACAWHWLTTLPSMDDACASGLLFCYGETSSETWLAAPGGWYDVTDDFKKYVAAIYWVFTTMTTVGYGDFFPMNNWERAFAVVVMIIGATVFGYIVGSVAEMASNTRQKPSAQHIFTMRQYCEEHGFHQKVIQSIRRHYDFWFQEMSHFEYEAEILQRLPTPLRKEVVLHIHRHILNSKLLLFKVPLPSWFQAVLLRLLEPQAFAPFELVLQSAEVTVSSDLIFVYDHSCEAFVHSGGRAMSHQPVRRRRRKKEVRVPYVDEAYTVLETYAPGAMLGFEQLLGEEALQSFGCPSDCAVRASSSGCNTFALKISAMLDAVRGMPGVDGMFLELIMSCILTEGKRRVKERGTNEFYQKIEAFRAAKQSYQAMMPLGLRVAAYAPSEAGSASLSPMRTGTERSPGSVVSVPLPTEEVPTLEVPNFREGARNWDPGGDRGEAKPPAPGEGDEMPPEPREGEAMPPAPGEGDEMPPEPREGELEPPMPGQGDQMPPEPREGEAKPPAPGEGETMLSAFGEGLLTSTTPPDSGSPPELHGLGPVTEAAPRKSQESAISLQ